MDKLFRISVAVGAMLVIASPAAADDGAAIGMGIAGMMIGAMAGAAAQQNQQRYYYRQRYVRSQPRIRYVRAAPHHVVAPRAGERTQVDYKQVTADTPWVMQTWHNCVSPKNVGGVQAHAERGFIKESYTTIFVCGDPQHFAKQFIYMSPSGYSGPDKIIYSEGGRVKAVENLTVGDYGKQYSFDTDLETTNKEERYVITLHGCGGVDVQADAKTGFANVRETDLKPSSEEATKCGRLRYVEKSVYYRALDGFEGQDTVLVRTAFTAPIHFKIAVTGGDQEPKVSSSRPEPIEEAPVKATEASAKVPSDNSDMDALAKMLNDKK